MGSPDLSAIIGLSSLGSMRGYRLVNYRVYVPGYSGENIDTSKRDAVIAVTRLGSLAVLSSLYTMVRTNLDKNDIGLSLGFITPITLLTDLGDNGEKLLELMMKTERRDCLEAYNKLASKMIEYIESTVKINNDDLNSIIDRFKKEGKSKLVVVPSNLTDCRTCPVLVDECKLPAIFHTNCDLTISILRKENNENTYKEEEVRKRIDLYLAFVPVTMASRIREKVVVFREERRKDIERWNQAFDTVVSYSMSRILKLLLTRLRSKSDVIFFIDTTHGINMLVSALSRNEHIAWISALLGGPTRAYLLRYNSDPFPLRPPGNSKDTSKPDMQSFNATFDFNMSYYFTPVEHEVVFNILRAEIDKLVEYYKAYREKKHKQDSDVERAVSARLLVLYLVKLGLLPWAIASVKLNPDVRDVPSNPYVVTLKVAKNKNTISVKYRVDDNITFNYITFLLSIYYDFIAKWLKDIYTTIRCKTCGENSCRELIDLCFEESKEAICISLKDLKSILYSVNQSGDDRRYLLNYLIEPGMRVILLNEIEDYEENLVNRIGYLLPKAFRAGNLTCSELLENELHKTCNDTKIYCFTPLSRIKVSRKVIRNFIAHAGLTRLVKNIGVVVNEKCRAECICIAQALEENQRIMDEFTSLLWP